MSAATPSTASSTSFTSKSPTPSEPRGGDITTPPKHSRLRFAWCITGSGHFLEESLALAARLPALDLFLSDAAEEVLPIYKLHIEELKPRFGRAFGCCATRPPAPCRWACCTTTSTTRW